MHVSGLIILSALVAGAFSDTILSTSSKSYACRPRARSSSLLESSTSLLSVPTTCPAVTCTTYFATSIAYSTSIIFIPPPDYGNNKQRKRADSPFPTPPPLVLPTLPRQIASSTGLSITTTIEIIDYTTVYISGSSIEPSSTGPAVTSENSVPTAGREEPSTVESPPRSIDTDIGGTTTYYLGPGPEPTADDTTFETVIRMTNSDGTAAPSSSRSTTSGPPPLPTSFSFPSLTIETQQRSSSEGASTITSLPSLPSTFSYPSLTIVTVRRTITEEELPECPPETDYEPGTATTGVPDSTVTSMVSSTDSTDGADSPTSYTYFFPSVTDTNADSATATPTGSDAADPSTDPDPDPIPQPFDIPDLPFPFDFTNFNPYDENDLARFYAALDAYLQEIFSSFFGRRSIGRASAMQRKRDEIARVVLGKFGLVRT